MTSQYPQHDHPPTASKVKLTLDAAAPKPGKRGPYTKKMAWQSGGFFRSSVRAA